MSTAHIDISYDLIDGIFDVLDGNVIYSGTTYPVYKSIPKTPESVYVHIADVIQSEDGTKDNFVYYGTVRIEVVDESKYRGDRKLAQKILGVVRGLLKTTKGGTFTCGSLNLIIFSHEVLNEFIELSDDGQSRVRLIDNYNFVIE